MNKIILASQSKVRKEILSQNKINCDVIPSNIDEDSVKTSLSKINASPEIISKNLAELKANKVSSKFIDKLVIGADSVIDLEGKIISKPTNRNEALEILKLLNGKSHYLISSVCISKGGNMIGIIQIRPNFMKKFELDELKNYLSKLWWGIVFYNVYQIEGLGKTLFSDIKGDNDTIMGLPVKKIKEFLIDYN